MSLFALLCDSAPCHPRAWLFGLSALGLSVFGCQPKVGDPCATSIDCSQKGDRLCDASQPLGYCTIFNCEPDKCPENSVCLGFGNQIDATCGDVFDPRWARFERTFCMKACETTSDCRDGYVCAAPSDRRAITIDLTSEWKDFKVCFPATEVPANVSIAPTPACYPTGASSGVGPSSSSATSSTTSSSVSSTASTGTGMGGAGGTGSTGSAGGMGGGSSTAAGH